MTVGTLMAPAPWSAGARIRMLGSFEVVVRGARVERWRAGRAKTLLQYMLAHPGRPISRAELIANVWEDSSANAPGTALKVAVHCLRRVLADSFGRGSPSSGPNAMAIVSLDIGYQLEIDGVDIDAREFASLVDRGIRAERVEGPTSAVAWYRRAIGHYGGMYLPECLHPWAAIERERLKDLSLHAFDGLSRAAERAGDLPAVADLNHRMLQIDPCREESYRSLMRCHARMGQLGRVCDWYRTCARQLAVHLDTEPDAATRQVFHDSITGRVDFPEIAG
jgi:two-component SAPR family response regulator